MILQHFLPALFAIVPALALADQKLDQRLQNAFPPCDTVERLASTIMTRRVEGATVNELMETAEGIELRATRWVVKLMIYDAFYGEPNLFDPADEGSPMAQMIAPVAFSMMWEMDCMGQKAWLEKQDETSQQQGTDTKN